MTSDSGATRAVIYVRQSLTRGEADESLSLESQDRACREYVASRGWRLVSVFTEPDTRGWRTDRPEFTKMLETLREGRADVCVVFKLSRFARNLIHQETVLNDIAAAGGELVSVTEPFLNGSPMVRQILGAVNEQAKRDQSDFLTASFAERARRGYPHGYAPIGYAKDSDGRLVIDEETVDTVRRIFDRALAGDGSRTIALDLNEDGITTSRGRDWTHATVLDVIRNPAYAGHVRYRGEIVARDAHPPIIDDEKQQQAISAISRRRGIRRKGDDTSWADGFVYHSCGRRMYLTAWRKTPQGETRWRYRCNAQFDRKRMGDRACLEGGGSAFAELIEDMFLDQLAAAFSAAYSPEEAKRRMEKERKSSAPELDRRRSRLQKRLSEVERQRDRLLDMTLAGRVDEEMYVMRDATLKSEISRIKAELESVPEDTPIHVFERRYNDILSISEKLPVFAHSASARLPELLHALDVRIVVGEDGASLLFGEAMRPFFY